MKRFFILLKDFFSNIFLGRKYDLFYVVDAYGWVIDQEWRGVSANLNKTGLVKSRITSTHIGLRNKLIHFGSIGTFVNKKGCKKVHPSNKVILTWFHVVPDDVRHRFISDINKNVNIFHTACDITKGKLIQMGIDSSKIAVVPLGVDLQLLKPANNNEKQQFRSSLGITKDVVIIGSFQKDGDGWKDGENPKLIKGPDIFCNVVEKLSKKHPIHVLLTGPARGYVLKRLNKSNIKYTHAYLKKFEDIVRYYQLLDLYLICSREEGGPKALLESMACGVPLVSTKVGMAPEVIENGLNGYLAEVGDEDQLFYLSDKLLSDSSLRRVFAEKGLEKVVEYDHRLISKIYWDEIYSKLVK